MGKNIQKTAVFFALSFVFLLFASPIYPEKEAGCSADFNYNLSNDKNGFVNDLARDKENEDYLKKELAIKNYLEKNDSPMVESTRSFIKACRKYNIDCFLLPSIAGLESTFGKFILPGSYNPFGWDRGYMTFKDWDEAIMTVAEGLKNHYVYKGAETVEEIGPIYSESPTWAPRVNFFINKFNQELDNVELFFASK